MSCAFRFTDVFAKEQVIQAVADLGLEIADHKDSSLTQFLITDGKSYVWAYNSEDGSYVDFVRYGANYDAESDILEPLANKLNTKLLSEHDDEFFDSEEYV